MKFFLLTIFILVFVVSAVVAMTVFEVQILFALVAAAVLSALTALLVLIFHPTAFLPKGPSTKSNPFLDH